MHPTRVLCTRYVVKESIVYTQGPVRTLQAPHRHANAIGYVDHVRGMDGLVRKTLFPVFN
jgi:hypothetical protein